MTLEYGIVEKAGYKISYVTGDLRLTKTKTTPQSLRLILKAIELKTGKVVFDMAPIYSSLLENNERCRTRSEKKMFERGLDTLECYINSSYYNGLLRSRWLEDIVFGHDWHSIWDALCDEGE